MKEIVLGFHNSCFLNLSDSFSDGRFLYSVCQHSGVISCVPGRIDFCSYYFHIFRFSRSGKGEVNLYRFMSKVRLVQITMCFFVTITRHISPSMRHHTWSWCIEGQTFSYIFVVVFVLQTIWKSLFAAIGRKIYVISTECVAAVLSFRYPRYNLDFQTIVRCYKPDNIYHWEQWILLLSNLNWAPGNHWNSRETKFTFPKETSH